MTRKNTLEFDVVMPRQSASLAVFTFAARAADIARLAKIECAGRTDDGLLTGFQRPQIAAHINEIGDYLKQPDAILPNAIVVAFMDGATIAGPDTGGRGGGRVGRLVVDVGGEPPGWIVDGQQRFTALANHADPDFEVLVSGFICESVAELHKQFILINNTRPLPKALVYELLPQVEGLPLRMSSRSRAAILVEALNFRRGSSLSGLIKQQTNPRGMVRDTVLQRVIMNSISDGALRLYASDDHLLLDKGFTIVSEFFHAVQHLFRDAWKDKTPKTSRLVHGTGIAAMGYVMDALHTATGAADRDAFIAGLRPLVGKTAWTGGEWMFGKELRPWNTLQYVPRDISLLGTYLTRLVRRAVPAEDEAA